MRYVALFLVVLCGVPTVARCQEPPVPVPVESKGYEPRPVPPLPAQPVVGRGEERERRLREKIAELQRAQAEVDELRRATDSQSQIVLHIRILELSLTKMRQAGFELPGAPGNETFSLQAHEQKGFAGLIEAMLREKVVRVLSEPTLMTLDGRPGSYLVGGQIPFRTVRPDKSVTTDFRQFGTKIDTVATLLDHGKVRVDIRADVSEIDPALSVTADDGTKIPGLRAFCVETGLVMDLDKTMTVRGLRQRRTTTNVDPQTKKESTAVEETEHLILVTPQLVNASNVPQADAAQSPAPVRR